MKTYKKGDNYKDGSYKTYGITEIDLNPDPRILSSGEHAQKIEVHGDIELRNRIIKLLNKNEMEKK